VPGTQSPRATGNEDLSATNVRTIINVADGANAYVHPNHSGEVTSAADGAQTIAANNATAATAGVAVGGLYHTNANPAVVCIRTA
jgi:hypothetical protein